MATGCNGRIVGLAVLCLAIVVGVSLSAFAGSASVDGTDYIVSAEAGETYQINTPIGNYSRLVKKGAGEVVLTASTTTFAGSVVVEEGTLSITELGALGASSPVAVENGATFYFKTPQGSFSAHMVTIAGNGVDGNGAIRFMPSVSDNQDKLLGDVTLAASATIECDYRWGVNGEIKLNGHRLRRICNNTTGSQWLLNGTKVSGPGTVEVGNGQLVFQGDVDSSADVTYVVTNASIVALWETKRVIPSVFKCFAGTKIFNASGTNHISGPIQLLNHAGAVSDGYVTFDVSAPRVLHLDGPITCDENMAYNTANNGCLFLNGDVSASKWVYVNSGTHVAMTTTASRVYSSGFGVNGGSMAWIGDGHTLFYRVRPGTDADKQGSFRQTGGVLGVTGDVVAGAAAMSVGHWAMSGGEAYMSNNVYLAMNAGSFGSFVQTGGLYQGRTDSFHMYAGNAGSAVFHVSGGTNDTRIAQDGQGVRFRIGEGGGFSDVTVSGNGTLLATETLRFGGSVAASTNVFTAKDGAMVKARRFRKNSPVAAGTLVYVNADGATLMPTFGYGWTDLGCDNPGYYDNNPDHFVIWKKGLVIDTSESTGTHPESYIPFSFESPSGKGVESIALPTEGGYTNSVYVGLARIVFEDETGWGASAYAEYDFNTNKLTKVVVTSRGCNYSDNAKAYVESPDRTTRYECALTLSDNAGMCGELVKRGQHDLYLHATNALTGGIAVESGTLHAETTGVVPTNTSVRVEYGATLQFANPAPLFLSSFAGAGSVPNCDITVTNSVRATCTDLFAGRYAAIDGTLTFAPGATFTITDPENLIEYEHSKAVTAFAAAQINGAPTLTFEGTPAHPAKWKLARYGAATYKFGPTVATVIVLR